MCKVTDLLPFLPSLFPRLGSLFDVWSLILISTGLIFKEVLQQELLLCLCHFWTLLHREECKVGLRSG